MPCCPLQPGPSVNMLVVSKNVADICLPAPAPAANNKQPLHIVYLSGNTTGYYDGRLGAVAAEHGSRLHASTAASSLACLVQVTSNALTSHLSTQM
jgi:hypothetical protein